MTHAQLLYAYSFAGAGPGSLRRILDSFPSPDAAWAASAAELVRIGLRLEAVATINSRRSAIDPLAVWQELEDYGVSAVTLLDGDYPTLLRQVHRPPPLLTYRGTLPKQPCVAVVGTRRCTPYGREVAHELSRQLAAAGVTVVSGLARGVDAAAHRGALAGGGQTVAVVGTGLGWGVLYPADHLELAAEIIEHGGCLLSEHCLNVEARPESFPRRNRTLAGLCLAVTIVEAGERSGALNTAGYGLELNREVLAVPGPITSAASAGTNRLIAQGARPILSADDILDSAGLGCVARPAIAIAEPGPSSLTDVARRVLESVPSHRSVTPDELISATGLTSGTVAVALTELELLSLVERHGSLFTKITKHQ